MQVTITDFIRYRQLKRECRQLARQIEALEQKGSQVATDKVTGSLPHFPYTQATFKIVGLVHDAGRLQEKKDQLKQNTAEAHMLINKLARFLNRMPKDKKHREIRETLELYYIDGLLYNQIPKKLGLEGDGSALMKKAKKYMKTKMNVNAEN